MSDIQASSTAVKIPTLMLTIGPKLPKHTHSPNTTPDDQHGKRAHAGTKRANISNKHGLPPIQPKSDNAAQPKTRSSKTAPAASYSSDYPEPELINLPSSPVKGDANPNDGVVIEASGTQGVMIETLLWVSVMTKPTQVLRSLTETVTYG